MTTFTARYALAYLTLLCLAAGISALHLASREKDSKSALPALPFAAPRRNQAFFRSDFWRSSASEALAPPSDYSANTDTVSSNNGKGKALAPDALAYPGWSRPTKSELDRADKVRAASMSDGAREGDGRDADSSSKTGWVYVIRHGEKPGGKKHHGLSPAGKRRAQCLKRVFGSGDLKAQYAMAPAYKRSGARRRAYDTLKPLSRYTGMPLDTSCQRDDSSCVHKVLERETSKGNNVVVAWQHTAISSLVRGLGVKGLVWDKKRYDMIIHIKKGKVHRIDSEECEGLDKRWLHWHAKKGNGKGKGGQYGRIVDDESWAEGAGEDQIPLATKGASFASSFVAYDEDDNAEEDLEEDVDLDDVFGRQSLGSAMTNWFGMR